jgi:hypothetical protein
MEQTIFFLTNKNRNLKNKHNTLRKKNKKHWNKIIKSWRYSKFNISKRAIKAFIDFFYFGLKFTELVSYEERINKFLGRLNSKQNIKKIDPILLS